MFSNFSVRKPYTIIVAVVLIGILGAVSLINMSTDLLPSINLPYAIISTSYEGASPEEVETVLSKPIEQQMASISNIQNVQSISSEESSMIILEFTESTNMDSALIEMRESLDMIMAYMPDEVSSPIILKLNPDMMPINVLSASVENKDIGESSKFIENKIIPELEGVEGVAYVQSNGLLENRIEAIITEKKIDEVNKSLVNNENYKSSVNKTSITAEMVSGILQGQNFSMPTGYITEDDVKYLVRTGDELKNLEDLKKLPVLVPPFPDMEPILLEDVAEINEVNNSKEVYNKVNGNDAVIISIRKQTEFNTSDVAKDIRTRIDKIMNENNVNLVSLMDQGEYIDLVVSSISKNLIFGGTLAILILLIFLRDFKPTIVVGFAIPVSLVTAFVMMYFSNVSLNIISMGGLALGVGMLVDNSIVVIENIYRMRNEGKSATEAAIQGAKQVTGAITSSTLTTISVFLPILFTEGLTREIFTDMGLTIAYSLIASLIIAVTLVPMLSSKILKKDTKKEHKLFKKIQNTYSKMLKFTLNHKLVIILFVIALFAGSIYAAYQSGTEFFPASDTGEITLTATMADGSTYKEAIKTSDKILDSLEDIKEIETVGASFSKGGIFSMGLSGDSSNSLSIYVLLKDKREKTTTEVSQLIRNKTKDINVELSISDSNMDLSSINNGGDISVEIKGKDFETLEELATKVEKIISKTDGTTEVDNGIEKTESEISIVVDKEKSIKNGLTIAQVYQSLSSVLKESSADSELSLESKDYDIYIKDENSDSDMTKDNLKKFKIENSQGDKIKLSDIADIEEIKGFGSITRSKQQRMLTVSGNLEEDYNIGIVSKEIQKKLYELKMPDGYSIKIGGEYKSIIESFKDLFLMLILAVVFIYLIMVAQFQSLLSPFIVMFTIPLAFTGGFLGLFITRNPVSVIAMVGLIILSGVVVNNGIVFVDYINIMRREGRKKRAAILKTGKDRLRPIIMTALTTIFALLTLSVGVGQGTEMMQPMAITAIGGLIYATVITLFLIPVLYEILNRKKYSVDVDDNE